MNNLPLQPLVWKDLSHGDVFVVRVDTPMYDYAIVDDSKAFKVGYYNLQSPIKYATGFATIDEAKAWAWNHYNEKMRPYISNTQTWIDASKQLPQVDKDTQFICAYDSAIEPYVRVTTFSVEMGDFGLDHADVLAWMPIPKFSTMQNNKGE